MNFGRNIAKKMLTHFRQCVKRVKSWLNYPKQAMREMGKNILLGFSDEIRQVLLSQGIRLLAK